MTKLRRCYRCCTQADEHIVTTADDQRDKITVMTQEASFRLGFGAQTTSLSERSMTVERIEERRSAAHRHDDAPQSLPPLRSASLDEPDSMLAGYCNGGLASPQTPSTPAPPPTTNVPQRGTLQLSRSLPLSLNRSQIVSSINRRSTVVFRQKLEVSSPRVVETRRGFPGFLTEQQLIACLQFREQLNRRDEVYRQMVRSFAPVESEAYAICRYMRSRNFCIRRTFEMMDGVKDLYLEGKAKEFFPDAEKAIGAPESVLLNQFPLLLGGTAKNGCPICYFDATNFLIEGIECITPLDNIPNYMWHLITHKLKDRLVKALADGISSVARVQLLLVIDLKGLRLATLNNAMSALEKALKILCVFPEILFCATILNAPGFFKESWGIIKTFLDRNTAKKIEIYSNETEGKKRLLELVDAKELASDFGGTAMSTTDTISQRGMVARGDGESALPGARLIRQIFRLISIPATKNGNIDQEFAFDVAKDEQVSLAIYTKSKAGADLALGNTDDMVKKSEVFDGGSRVRATYSVEAGSLLDGPDTCMVPFKSKPLPGDTEKLHYFLIVGYVFTEDKSGEENGSGRRWTLPTSLRPSIILRRISGVGMQTVDQSIDQSVDQSVDQPADQTADPIRRRRKRSSTSWRERGAIGQS